MSAVILHWKKHKLIRHTELGGCLVCGSWEGEMPTDCPGREMTISECNDVLNGRLDYRVSEGGWTTFTRQKYLRNKTICEGYSGRTHD